MTDQYHIHNIRRLLLKSFNITELKVLMHDQPAFRDVEDLLARGDSKEEIVDELIEYANRRLRIDTLLGVVQELRPERYEDYGPYHSADHAAVQRRIDALLYEEVADVGRGPEERLFGRGDLRRRVHRLLDKGRQVLLHGFTGNGKTALARIVAEQRIADALGPVLWLEPGREDAGAVFEALVRRFAIEREKLEFRSLGDDARVPAVRKLLARSGASLLVLDNVWNGPALHRVLKPVPEDMPVLVTSQQRFPLKEMIEVGELTIEAALELLCYKAGEEGYRQDADARDLCENLGCHAYAVEIAGTTLKVDGLKPGQLARQIVAAPHDVPMPEGFAEEGRESVKMLLDTSFHALDEEAQRVFETFGRLFAPSATSALLATCLKEEQADVEKQLRMLVRRSLAKRLPDTDYYYFLYLTGRYAQAMVKARGQDHREIVAAVARYTEEHVRDLDGLALDLDNILEAARAAQVEDVEALKTIVSVLATGGYMDARGHTPGFLELLDEAIEAVRQEGPEGNETVHYLLSKRGNAHFDRGELEQAYETFQAALELAPNANRQVILLAVLGKVRSEQGHHTEADDCFERAGELAEANADQRALAFLLQQRSYTLGRRGDFEAARDCAASAVELCGQLEIPNSTELGYLLLNLGSAEFLAGVHRARSFHLQAREIAQAEGELDLEAAALHALGSDYHALYEYEEAQKHLAEARRLFRQSGNTAEEAEVAVFMKRYGYLMA